MATLSPAKNVRWNESQDSIMLSNSKPYDAHGSTEKLAEAALPPRPVNNNRRKRLLIVIAVVALLVTAGGVTVGVLAATNVLRVSSSSAPASHDAASAGAGSPPGAPVVGGGASTTSSSSLSRSPSSSATSTSATPTPTAIPCSSSVPSAVAGTFNDITKWSDMTGFNCTYTDEKVGGLSLLGLNSTWDDSKQANPNVPALNKPWGSYAAKPIRGVNLGGWLSLEPFITPSLFTNGAVDEHTLCTKLGDKAAETLDKHYATFITEADFKAIADAGLDHIRIPYSYWAVKTYEGDPFVEGVSWRYLLRGIEWARKYGLRVNLDLHGLPGSQNGWNHSGRQGKPNWIIGPDGDANAKRSLEIHDQLSKFFAQERYRNVVAFYGLANEPAQAFTMDQLKTWTTQAYKIVKDNGVTVPQIFGDSMKGLEAWTGQMQGYGDGLVIDSHQYAIFNNDLLAFKHTQKVEFACKSFTEQVVKSMAGGFGPTMVGEWSQADTDCAKYLNGVGNGARWTGTFSDTLGQPRCAAQDSSCSCEMTNGDPAKFTADYKKFLKTWAMAQMSAFEKSWGWFYWTWKTENAPLWSYQAGIQGGFMPAKAYERDWDCSMPIPSFGSLPEGN